MHNYYVSILLVFLSSLVFSISNAEINVVDFGSTLPTEKEFLNALTPQIEAGDTQVETGRVRRIRSIKKVQTEPEQVAVNLSLTFEFDSAELTSYSKSVLNNLGGAIKKGLVKYSFRIEGHTDAIGEKQYNQALSEQRANSVKNYLVNHFEIESLKLETVGKGENELFNGNVPAAAENRRVEIVNLGVLE